MNKKILNNLKTAVSELMYDVTDTDNFETQNKPVDVAQFEPPKTLEDNIENPQVVTQHQKSIICASMDILGDVNINAADLEVYGTIKGNINCSDGTIYIFNSHKGDITARTIVISQCSSVVGNLYAKDTIQIDTDSTLKGHINAGGSIFINGRLYGNATAGAEIYFGSDALIKGDITSNGIVVTKGAKICGTITDASDNPKS